MERKIILTSLLSILLISQIVFALSLQDISSTNTISDFFSNLFKNLFGITSEVVTETIITIKPPLMDAWVNGRGGCPMSGGKCTELMYGDTNYGTDTELHVRQSQFGTNYPERTYIMFNISDIPSGATINSAQVCMYKTNNGATGVQYVYHVKDHTWDDKTGSTITWNNQVCGANFDDTGDCNTVAESSDPGTAAANTWVCWNVINVVRNEYGNGDKDVSFAFKSTEPGLYEDRYASKEYATSNLAPYLRINFSTSVTTSTTITPGPTTTTIPGPTTTTIPGPISCSNCDVGSCSCSISTCQSGILDVYNSPNQCVFTPAYTFTFSGGTKTWQPESLGTYYLRALCDDGATRSECVAINVGGTTTTTTTLISGDFEVSSVSCDPNECTLNVRRNSLSEQVVIFFELVDDTGEIYYSSNLNLDPGPTGEKKLVISRVRSCPNDTELDLLVLVYRQSNLDSRIYRISDKSFVC